MLTTIFTIIILLFSIILHEVAHGCVAYRLKDPTAKYAGRLSLNPLVHLDPIGSFLFPIFTLLITSGKGPVFGWAKPVPINPYNFSDQKWGRLKVAISGPLMNFGLALLSGLTIRFFILPNLLLSLLSIICIYNIFWGIFNLVPISPLDGSHILFSVLENKNARAGRQIQIFMQQYGLLLLFLFLFWGLSFIEPLVTQIYFLITGRAFAF